MFPLLLWIPLGMFIGAVMNETGNIREKKRQEANEARLKPKKNETSSASPKASTSGQLTNREIKTRLLGTPFEGDELAIELMRNSYICPTDKSNNVRLEDIAGLDGAKDALSAAVTNPIRFPELYAMAGAAPPKGILLYGPPGTGKTYLARAVASEAHVSFFCVSGSDIFDKYLGQSEKKMSTLFGLARLFAPSIIFIDEVESICGSREGTTGKQCETTARIKTDLLQQMDGAKANNDKQVLVLGATNLPWSIDDAFRRRFEQRIYIPLPDKIARAKLFEIQLKGLLAYNPNVPEGEGEEKDTQINHNNSKTQPTLIGGKPIEGTNESQSGENNNNDNNVVSNNDDDNGLVDNIDNDTISCYGSLKDDGNLPPPFSSIHPSLSPMASVMPGSEMDLKGNKQKTTATKTTQKAKIHFDPADFYYDPTPSDPTTTINSLLFTRGQILALADATEGMQGADIAILIKEAKSKLVTRCLFSPAFKKIKNPHYVPPPPKPIVKTPKPAKVEVIDGFYMVSDQDLEQHDKKAGKKDTPSNEDEDEGKKNGEEGKEEDQTPLLDESNDSSQNKNDEKVGDGDDPTKTSSSSIKKSHPKAFSSTMTQIDFWYIACSKDDPDAQHIKVTEIEPKWKLIPPKLIFKDLEAACKKSKCSVGKQTSDKYTKWTNEFGSNGD
jgi:SpoVK/Ycf46/Vps4 family AAA+-type ATPase